MPLVETSASARPVRWGLAAKLFAILLLLGAVAVLVTGVLGYMRARDALQEAVFNQLTAARQSKARQIETYFRTIRNALRLLATSKMMVDARACFRAASTSSSRQTSRSTSGARSATGMRRTSCLR